MVRTQDRLCEVPGREMEEYEKSFDAELAPYTAMDHAQWKRKLYEGAAHSLSKEWSIPVDPTSFTLKGIIYATESDDDGEDLPEDAKDKRSAAVEMDIDPADL